MNNCIWIINVKNCNTEYLLKPIIIVGLIISIVLLIITIVIIYYKKKIKKNWKLIDENDKIQYFESSLLNMLIIYISKILYFSLLLSNHKQVWYFPLINEISNVFIFLGLLLILIILFNLFPDNIDLYIIKKKYLISIYCLYIITVISISLITGFKFQSDNQLDGYIYLGIEMIIYSLYMTFYGIIILYYCFIYFKINKYHKRIKIVKDLYLSSGISLLIFGPLGIFEGIYMIKNNINFESIKLNILFFTMFYFYGGLLFAIIIHLYHIK